ncbi:response regulator transcription factor [Chitinophaga sp.]|uniref:response regulator transcription factor n=1 Tax=Chitinophaga sp. TaxID=1869181 RepID=UPI0031CEB25C
MNVPNNDPGVNDVTQRILLVTGDAGMARKIRQLLTEQYTLLNTNSITEGIEMAYQHHPDLILCDAMVQDATGYQFLITLRNDAVLKPIPFILFSRPNMPANMRKGMNLGADDYLVAPFTGEELLKSIHSRISRFHHIRDTPNYYMREKMTLQEVSTLAINDRLSKTEAKILGMIARGMSSRDIASYKCISVRTVDNHRHNITKKLQLSGPNALVKFAIGFAGAMK